MSTHSRAMALGSRGRRPSRLEVAAWVLGCLTPGPSVLGQALYDPTLGTVPSAQGWSYVSLPIAAQMSFADGATVLNTTAATQILAGFSRVSPTILDRNMDFTVAFSLKVNSEDHGTRVDRAGVSVTVLASDRKGIELGFWADRVWAQSDSPMFTHAEEAAFNTTVVAVNYTLTMVGNTYTLFANGESLLTGPVRDYTGFVGAIDPYETPNFLFVGDNTTSARASMSLGSVEVASASPEPPALGIEAHLGGIRLSWPATPEAWTLEATEQLGSSENWQSINPTVETANGQNYANLPASDGGRFFRLHR